MIVIKDMAKEEKTLFTSKVGGKGKREFDVKGKTNSTKENAWLLHKHVI